jgi:large subunit ribosomal protein L14e
VTVTHPRCPCCPLQVAKVKERWSESSWAKKLVAKQRRASLTDFDRFKLMVARKQKAEIVKKHL